MPCYYDGNGMIICSKNKLNVKKCYKCGKLATLLCDSGNTQIDLCDKPMCRECAHKIGRDNHVCDEHYNELDTRKAKYNRNSLAELHIRLYGSPEYPYMCPKCKNEDHSQNANYCKICGLKIEKDGVDYERN